MAECDVDIGNNRYGISDGVSAPVRGGKTGEMIIGQAHGEFYEATVRSNVFYAATAVAGVSIGTSLSTTAAFYLHNPVGSGKNLSLIAVSIGYLSGTMGSGAAYLCTHTGVSVANPTGTAITPRPTLLGGNAVGVGLAFTTATVTTQIAIRPICSFGPFLATTVFQPTALKDSINGEIVVAPGFGVGVHGIATAGTTDRVLIGCTWEEVNIS